MTFSSEWDDVYKSNNQLSLFPWSDLVSYVMRYIKPTGPGFKVLELGCGAGANIPFFQHLNVDYYAIEGSSSIVYRLWERFPTLKDHIICGDFTKDIPFSTPFHLIVDRSALIHNTTSDIKNTLKYLKSKLLSGGHYVGIDWFSTLHSDYHKGVPFEDDFTRAHYESGQFKGIGQVHFVDEAHLRELFSGYDMKVMELKTVHQKTPLSGHTFSSWNFVAQNKE